jgi:hypothetical protein
MHALRGLAALVVLLSPVVQAQTSVPGFDLERLSLNPGATHSLFLQTGDGLEAQALRVSLVGHLEHDPLIIFEQGTRAAALVGHRFTTHLLLAWGLRDAVELGLQLPVVLSQSGDDVSAYGRLPVVSPAAAPLLLQARVTFLRERQGAPVDLGLQAGLALPLGLLEALTRDPGLGLAGHVRLGAGRAFGFLRLGGELGLVLREPQVLSRGQRRRAG